jgi:hypothetical protein
MALTEQQRRLRASLGGHARAAKAKNRSDITAAARAAGPGNLEWHAARIDPDHEMDPAERAKAAENARAAWYRSMALRSSIARAARKAEGGDAA